MKTTRKIATIFAAAAIATAPLIGTTAAVAAPTASPTDVVVPGGTNTREIIVTLDQADRGLDSAQIQLVGATWTNVAAAPPVVNTISTNPTTFSACGSSTSGVSVKTATAASDYRCSLLMGVDAILDNDPADTAFGETVTFRIAPGAITFSSTAPSSGVYSIVAILSAFDVSVYTTTIQLTVDNSSPAPAPNPAPAPEPATDSETGAAATLAKTGTENGSLAPAVAALLLLAAGGTVLLARRKRTS